MTTVQPSTKETIKKWLDKGFLFAFSYKKVDDLSAALEKKNVATSSKMALDTAYAQSLYCKSDEPIEIKCWNLTTEYEKSE